MCSCAAAGRALRGLPLLLDQHSPEPERIPGFLLALGNATCWEGEKECFADVAKHLGEFYAVRPSLRELAEEADMAADRSAEGSAGTSGDAGADGSAGGDAGGAPEREPEQERAAGPPRSGPVRAEREWVIAQARGALAARELPDCLPARGLLLAFAQAL